LEEVTKISFCKKSRELLSSNLNATAIMKKNSGDTTKKIIRFSEKLLTLASY